MCLAVPQRLNCERCEEAYSPRSFSGLNLPNAVGRHLATTVMGWVCESQSWKILQENPACLSHKGWAENLAGLDSQPVETDVTLLILAACLVQQSKLNPCLLGCNVLIFQSILNKSAKEENILKLTNMDLIFVSLGPVWKSTEGCYSSPILR